MTDCHKLGQDFDACGEVLDEFAVDEKARKWKFALTTNLAISNDIVRQDKKFYSIIPWTEADPSVE